GVVDGIGAGEGWGSVAIPGWGSVAIPGRPGQSEPPDRKGPGTSFRIPVAACPARDRCRQSRVHAHVSASARHAAPFPRQPFDAVEECGDDARGDRDRLDAADPGDVDADDGAVEIDQGSTAL